MNYSNDVEVCGGHIQNNDPRHVAEIDIPTIELIHRLEDQQDGYVSFCRKMNGKHQDLAGIRINDLRKALPELLPWLSEDAYFSINASYRAAPFNNALTGLPSAWRRERVLRYLNTCFADLDFYKLENSLNWPDAVKIILKAQEDGSIPLASIIGRSGRGMYLLWLLTSGRNGAQQRAFPDEIELYKMINRAFYERLNSINPRLNADRIFDAARILRVPGSMNTKSGSKVQYLVEVDDQGQVPVYTLAELASFFEISHCPYVEPHQEKSLYNRPIVSRGAAPKRRKGRIATGEYRLNDLLTLFHSLGGFERGKRRRSITYFCYFAKAAGWTRSDILEKAKLIAEGCVPPYPSEQNDTPVQEIVNHVWNDITKNFRNDKLAKFFEVSPELADELQLRSIIPAEVKKEREAQLSKGQLKRNTRLSEIERIVRNEFSELPSHRKIQKALEILGIKASLGTVYHDTIAVLNTFASHQGSA